MTVVAAAVGAGCGVPHAIQGLYCAVCTPLPSSPLLSSPLRIPQSTSKTKRNTQPHATNPSTPGIKNMHLLPVIAQFVSMAQELESLMSDTAAEVELTGQMRAQRAQQGRGAEAWEEGGGGEEQRVGVAEDDAAQAAALSVRAGERLRVARGCECVSYVCLTGQGALIPAALPSRLITYHYSTTHPPPKRPSEIDSAYQALTGRLFACLERQAAGDAKYADRLRLENYGHFADELGAVQNKSVGGSTAGGCGPFLGGQGGGAEDGEDEGV